MIGDLRYEDCGTDRDERSPERHKLVAVNPDCARCNAEHHTGAVLLCGDGWYCTGDCKHLGEHIARDHYVCLHFAIAEASDG